MTPAHARLVALRERGLDLCEAVYISAAQNCLHAVPDHIHWPLCLPGMTTRWATHVDLWMSQPWWHAPCELRAASRQAARTGARALTVVCATALPVCNARCGTGKPCPPSSILPHRVTSVAGFTRGEEGTGRGTHEQVPRAAAAAYMESSQLCSSLTTSWAGPCSQLRHVSTEAVTHAQQRAV